MSGPVRRTRFHFLCAACLPDRPRPRKSTEPILTMNKELPSPHSPLFLFSFSAKQTRRALGGKSNPTRQHLPGPYIVSKVAPKPSRIINNFGVAWEGLFRLSSTAKQLLHN